MVKNKGPHLFASFSTGGKYSWNREEAAKYRPNRYLPPIVYAKSSCKIITTVALVIRNALLMSPSWKKVVRNLVQLSEWKSRRPLPEKKT